MNNKDIIQELSDLNSPLAKIPWQNVYTVPEGYFEGLATDVINRIKACEATNSNDELGLLSPVMSSISKRLPYVVPDGYFDEFEEKLTSAIRLQNDNQTVEDELFSLSPMLSGIGKHNPYRVPQGYFEGLENTIKLNNTHAASGKLVSLVNHKWFRFAAAAVLIGFITMTGIQFLNNNSGKHTTSYGAIDSNGVSTADINNFIQIIDEGADQNNIATSVKTDIKDLMKDVSDKDIQEFLKTSAGSEEADAENLLN